MNAETGAAAAECAALPLIGPGGPAGGGLAEPPPGPPGLALLLMIRPVIRTPGPFRPGPFRRSGRACSGRARSGRARSGRLATWRPLGAGTPSRSLEPKRAKVSYCIYR